MGRFKKVVQKSANEEENVEDDGRSKSPSKPAANLKKTLKARGVSPPVKDMVMNAMKELIGAGYDEGVPLAAIRNFICKTYNNGRKVGKDKQQRIKEFMEDEFNKGTIVMTNSDADEIIFTKRFNMAANAADSAEDVDLHTQPTESICKSDPKQFVQEREVESSLIYDLHSGDMSLPCRSMLSALESNGFIVRLHKPKVKKIYDTTHRSSGESGRRIRNATSCPLSIISTNDPLIAPWKIDPCQLETHGMLDEPVRLLPGRLKIIWNHYGNAPVYKLMITVLGKGYHCNQKGKHPCLRFGNEVMLCVSDTLVCDGIRHCPNGNEYDSDEDPDLCLKHKNNMDFKNSGNVFQHNAKEIRKIFPPEENVSVLTPPPKMTIVSSTTMSDLDTKRENRPSLTRRLSRYGPWGYLMLGMLLCGGALLICGLWECCCRHKKPTMPPDFDASANAFSTTSDLNSTANSSPVGQQTLPQINYDEVDPPPSYAALFPSQKTTNESNGITSSATQNGHPATLPTNI